MEYINSFDKVIAYAKKQSSIPAAIVAPYDGITLNAVYEGVKNGLIAAHLFGDASRISEAMAQNSISLPEAVIHDMNPLLGALDSIRSGETKLLMKGTINTPNLLGACLDKSKGINSGKICSQISVLEIPGHERLLFVSDAGLNVLPTLDQKAGIICNIAELAHSLGISNPKIAVLASVEEVKSNLPATVDAAALTMMAKRGQIRGCVVDGPLAMDNILSAESAKKKNIDSPVAGQADAIIVPGVETGNALCKALKHFSGSTNASVIAGMSVPVVLPSRSGELKSKLASLALCTLLAQKQEEKNGEN